MLNARHVNGSWWLLFIKDINNNSMNVLLYSVTQNWPFTGWKMRRVSGVMWTSHLFELFYLKDPCKKKHAHLWNVYNTMQSCYLLQKVFLAHCTLNWNLTQPAASACQRILKTWLIKVRLTQLCRKSKRKYTL